MESTSTTKKSIPTETDYEHGGVYVLKDDMIAFRDNHGHAWRASRVTFNLDGSVTLTHVGEFNHRWQIPTIGSND